MTMKKAEEMTTMMAMRSGERVKLEWEGGGGGGK